MSRNASLVERFGNDRQKLDEAAAQLSLLAFLGGEKQLDVAPEEPRLPAHQAKVLK